MWQERRGEERGKGGEATAQVIEKTWQQVFGLAQCRLRLWHASCVSEAEEAANELVSCHAFAFVSASCTAHLVTYFNIYLGRRGGGRRQEVAFNSRQQGHAPHAPPQLQARPACLQPQAHLLRHSLRLCVGVCLCVCAAGHASSVAAARA